MRTWGYLTAYLFPLLTLASWYLGGFWFLLVPVFAFGLVPVLDLLVGTDVTNREPTTGQLRVLRGITYAYVPVQTGLLAWGLTVISTVPLSAPSFWGLAIAMGLTTGGVGITLAHELGHRTHRGEQFLAQFLLAQVGYLHFFIEHNLGHHQQVATHDDPATSRLGESFYAFLPRTLVQSFVHGWQIQTRLLAKRGIPSFSLHNKILVYCLIELGIAAALGLGLGLSALVFFLVQAFLAVSLLELINYIEHYGLERRSLGPDRYERVQPHHSWNASYLISNFLLFNLQRHSDHHAAATRRYPQLRHYDQVPQLPTGYAGMVWLALIPPLFFAIMNPRVAQVRGNAPAL